MAPLSDNRRVSGSVWVVAGESRCSLLATARWPTFVLVKLSCASCPPPGKFEPNRQTNRWLANLGRRRRSWCCGRSSPKRQACRARRRKSLFQLPVLLVCLVFVFLSSSFFFLSFFFFLYFILFFIILFFFYKIQKSTKQS